MTQIIAPALSIAALATTLAVIILIAERYLMNYGEVELTVNKERKYRVQGGGTVLSTLKKENIFIPSACGGRATCAYCKVKAVSGFGEPLPTEEPLLTKEELAAGVRLSCQLKVKNDVAIEIPEELFSIREFKGRVQVIIDLTYDIKFFRFGLEDAELIDFKPGQYIQFQAPEYGEVDESVYRAYSMCNVPGNGRTVELMVRLVPEGICTTYMFRYLEVGNSVTFTGPFGDFFLRDSARRMICMAGGSGMAPLRSILRAMSSEDIARRRPIFFFGARAKRDLFMVDEWREFEQDHPDFRFIAALSSPEPEDHWDGETGYVTELVEKYVENISEAEGYLCGSPGMLNACVEVLIRNGMPKERIYYDKFE